MPLTFGSEGDKEEKLPGPIEARSEFAGAFPRKRILSPGEFAPTGRVGCLWSRAGNAPNEETMLILMWQLVGSRDDRIHGALRMDMSWSEGGRLLRTGQARSGRGAGACTAGEGTERVIE